MLNIPYHFRYLNCKGWGGGGSGLQRKYHVRIWPITAAGVPWLARALSCGARPSKQLSFGARGVVLAPDFCKIKRIILFKWQGNSMKQKLIEMIQVTALLHTDGSIFVWIYKNENGRQNHSLGAKTELLRRAGATT